MVTGTPGQKPQHWGRNMTFLQGCCDVLAVLRSDPGSFRSDLYCEWEVCLMVKNNQQQG